MTKILFISMPSVHVIRWIENLKDTSYELYWFDVLGRGKLETLNAVHQYTDWEKRKIATVKGEYFLSKKAPRIYEKIVPFLEVTANEALEKIIIEIQPDVIHSFEMQSCSYPILKTMQKYPHIPWLYSCWGNDLYYYQQFSTHLKKIKQVLQRVDFLHTDCNRDFILAKKIGFLRKHVGVIPGGMGYKLAELEKYKLPVEERKIILVKGYENEFGRGLNIIKALQQLKLDYEIIVFGSHINVINYIIANKLDFKVFDRHGLSHQELMELMGKSILYLGNSISDGMPNTLLEAIIMGAFPIQSNPGNASAEIVVAGKNGFLIENPNDEKAIATLILKILQDPELLQKAFDVNQKIAKERLDYTVNQQKILALYQQIEN